MFEKEIIERLREMHNSGKSYEDIARITGVSRTAVAEILAGKRHIKNPSVSMLLKVFPKAEIHLEGAHNTSIADRGGVSVQDISVSGGNNNFFSQQKEVIKKITDAVMTSDLDPEAKVKVYNIIKENSEG